VDEFLRAALHNSAMLKFALSKTDLHELHGKALVMFAELCAEIPLSVIPAAPPPGEMLFDMMPDTFPRVLATKAARVNNIWDSDTQITRWLNENIASGRLERIGRGYYEKVG